MVFAQQQLVGEGRRRRYFLYAAGALVPTVLVAVLAFAVADALFDSWVRWLAGALFYAAWIGPLSMLLMLRSLNEERELDSLTARREAELQEAVERADRESARREHQAQHQEFETQLLNALEMAESESEVLGVVSRAFAQRLPDRPVELLLADNSHAHLIQVASGVTGGRDAGLPSRVAERVPGGAARAGAAVPRQRRARRVPEAA